MRKTFVNCVEEIFNQGSDSVLILGDIGVFSFQQLKFEFPNRVLNIGILEQSMIGVASGYSSEGIIPIVHTIAPFLVERALEQIKIDFGYQKLSGNLVSVGASIDYSKLGATHHCPSDVSILSNVPGTEIFIPGHKDEFKNHFLSNWNSGSLNYFRLSEIQNKKPNDLKLGEIIPIKHGSLGLVIAVGPFLEEAIQAVGDLDIEIHYANSISSQNIMKINSSFPGQKVMIYEPYYSGPLLQKVISQINEAKCEILQVGIPNIYIHEYGTYQEILNFLRVDSKSLRSIAQDFFTL